jgi:outer membrane protein assembly factor BamB
MNKWAHFAVMTGLSALLAACGGGGAASAMPSSTSPTAPTPSAPSITIQPAAQNVALGQPATFAVTAAGTPPLSYQWQQNGAPISGADAASYTIPATVPADNGETFSVVVSNAAGSLSSSSAKLSLTGLVTTAGTDVLTYKNDLNRSGQNLTETTLAPANVTAASFGLLLNLAVDGKVDAQPLYVSQFSISGATHNVVYVATEHDSVYAFDSETGATLWKVSLLGSGETTSRLPTGILVPAGHCCCRT